MHIPTGHREIIARLEHMRSLLRGVRMLQGLGVEEQARRERKLKDLITNLRRTEGRAMVQMLDEVEEICSLTKGGAYRLFGYELDAIQALDEAVNAGRTHIERPHKRLSSREIHRALGVSNRGKTQRKK